MKWRRGEREEKRRERREEKRKEIPQTEKKKGAKGKRESPPPEGERFPETATPNKGKRKAL